MAEYPLKGGRTNPSVVRKDGQVHRAQPVNAEFIHRFLTHLQSVGFNNSPRFLGIDSQGREILSYIEGSVPDDLGQFSDEVLQQAGQLIRRLHDASREFASLHGGEVICHNDLSPCNFVFQDSRPIGIIDFDAAAPGKREWDIAYALWMWLDLGNEEIPAQSQGSRVKLFCDSYGITATGIFDKIMDRQRFHIQQNSAVNAPTALWAQECLEWINENRNALK